MDFKLGELLYYAPTDFDGSCVIPCRVVEEYADHYIAKSFEDNPMTLWIDEDTADLFKKESEYNVSNNKRWIPSLYN